jgi:hypothetical protein
VKKMAIKNLGPGAKNDINILKIFLEVWKILNIIDEKHQIFSNKDVFFASYIFTLLIQNFNKNLDEIKVRLDFLNELAGKKDMGDTKEFPEFLALFHLYDYKRKQRETDVSRSEVNKNV